jgi:hypothetical protein
MAQYSDDPGQIQSNAIVRLIIVVLFNLASMVVNKLILIIAFFQFLCHLLFGRVPRWSIRWGQAMSEWTYKMSLFMVYQTEKMPFPLRHFGSDPDLD